MRKTNLLKYLALTILIASIWSCAKEPDSLGLDLIPAGDLLQHEFTDTTSIFAYTVREDSLNTRNLASNLLGSIADPQFGTTTASIYTQYRMPKPNIHFGKDPIADSITLTLFYKGVYGDSLASQNILVYELSDSLNTNDSVKYYSTSTVGYHPEPIGQATFVPNFKYDSLKFIKITLSAEFANKLIQADTLSRKENKYFVKTFKGLYLTTPDATTPGSGSIIYYDLLNEDSKLTLHYRNTDSVTNVPDTLKMDFLINMNSVRFNHYEHYDYQGADELLLEQFIGNTEAGSQKLYIQAMAGAKIKITMPYIQNMVNNRRIAINEALLVLESADTTSPYPLPELIGMHQLKADSTYDGSQFIEGYAINNKEYRFRITRYVQNRLLNPEEPDYGLMLAVGGSALNASRAVLNGTGAEQGQLRLLVYYTLLD